jgi:hypothetical protein
VCTGRKHHYEDWKDDSTNLSRKKQVVVSILRTGYKRATHRHVIEKTPSPVCPFFGVSLTTEHILWDCTETMTEREREEKPEPRKRYGQMEQKD